MPDASADPDLRPSSQALHLALVSASSAMDGEYSARTPQEVFCARLRSARERRGVAVRTVADATKVTTSFFEALERGDISRWPKGLYKRAFFRGYVSAIGLPPDSTLEEFLSLFPDEKPAAVTAGPSSPRETVPTPPPLRLTLAPDVQRGARRVSRHAVLDAAVVAALALVLVWWAQVDLRTGAAILAICCYPPLARLARFEAVKYRTTATVRGTALASSPDEVGPDSAHAPVTATS